MKVTTRYVQIGLVLFATAGLPVQAVTWPVAGDWTNFFVGTSPYVDPPGEGHNPKEYELVGSTTYPTAYWDFNDFGTLGTADDLLYFRMRVDKAPGASGPVYQVLMDTDGINTSLEWTLQVDLGTDNRVELEPSIVTGPTFGAVTFGAAVWTGSTNDYYRVVNPTGDGSAFGSPSTADVFVDLAIPWDSFALYTGLTTNSAYRIGVATSPQDNNINKDYPLNLGSTSPVSSGLGEPINSGGTPIVPEPSTFWMVTAAMPLLLRASRNRRRAIK